MKKLIMIIFSLIVISINCVHADGTTNIENKLNSIWLSPIGDEDILENIYLSNQEKIEEYINLYLLAPAYAREKVGISTDDEEMKEQVKEFYRVNENEILKVYYINNRMFAKQYAENKKLKYLISDDFYWFIKVGNGYNRYEMNGNAYDQKKEDFASFGFNTITNEAVSFLRDKEKINDVFRNIDISTIKDIKLIALNQVCTCLYVDCGLEEYMIALYIGLGYEYVDGVYKSDEWIKNIELFKLYKASEFMQIISDEADVMNAQKPTFEEEAVSLQEKGLLYGNENGLDLLKPLTRIEAATMLLRAMGISTTTDIKLQTFTDVPLSHWGYGAAENAYSLGIIKGIGNNLFAPDDIVTATQFATMILRTANTGEFNWEEAIDILTKKGIITADEASTMDFFTRGDMAKIIYESIEKGIF